jgi:hypothetical protein
MLAHTTGDEFQSVGKIIARGDGVSHQSSKQQGDNPHQKHNLLLFDDLRISGAIKGYVKAEQRVGEGFIQDFSWRKQKE